MKKILLGKEGLVVFSEEGLGEVEVVIMVTSPKGQRINYPLLVHH